MAISQQFVTNRVVLAQIVLRNQHQLNAGRSVLRKKQIVQLVQDLSQIFTLYVSLQIVVVHTLIVMGIMLAVGIHVKGKQQLVLQLGGLGR